MKKRLYLCGPITGLPNHNRDAFNEAESALRSAGFDVFNPLENGLPVDAPWEHHMRTDIAQMMVCDGLAVLPCAHYSHGASIEIALARKLKIQPIRALEFWLGD
jgi:nucleoside 2-deoxyribosyltransferase